MVRRMQLLKTQLDSCKPEQDGIDFGLRSSLAGHAARGGSA